MKLIINGYSQNNAVCKRLSPCDIMMPFSEYDVTSKHHVMMLGDSQNPDHLSFWSKITGEDHIAVLQTAIRDINMF